MCVCMCLCELLKNPSGTLEEGGGFSEPRTNLAFVSPRLGPGSSEKSEKKSRASIKTLSS